LERALRRLRHRSDPQVLWVDAICINQSDDAERSQQVKVMGAIYKSTRHCKIWLGEVEEEPIQAVQRREVFTEAEVEHLGNVIKELKLTTPTPLLRAGKHGGDQIDVPGAFEIMELMALGKHLYEMRFYRIQDVGPVFVPSEVWVNALHSLESLLRRVWWLRIWTVQEALLPNMTTIHVGPHTAPFSIFLDGAVAWDLHLWAVRQSSNDCCSDILDVWMGQWSEHFKPAIDRILDLTILHKLRSAWTKDNPVAHTYSYFRYSGTRRSTTITFMASSD
jgi:hypothetical protein